MDDNKVQQKKVISADGTPIAYEQAGCGGPLILVHGTGADHTRWAAVLPALAEHFTVYVLDRRGHGASGDSPDYAIEHEYEDIAVLAAALGGTVDLLGHSFGAACALGAAPLIPGLRRLILYEPPMLHEQQTPQRVDLLQRMDAALDTGDREKVSMLLLVDMLGIPRTLVERSRGTPAWAGTISAAHTIPRELRSSSAYGADLEALRRIAIPTLFLLGSASPANFRETTETLRACLPNSQVAVFPGQQHSAMLTAPDLFAAEVIRFLCAA